MIHELKSQIEPFQATWDGVKTFDIRSTDNRKFHVGDTLLLREWNHIAYYYKRRVIIACVDYIMTKAHLFGVVDTHCLMSIRIVRRADGDEADALLREYIDNAKAETLPPPEPTLSDCVSVIKHGS